MPSASGVTLCEKPYMSGALAFGCQQCLPCRIKIRKRWAFRIMLESVKHAGNSFVTLTYSDENVPAGGSLVPKDTQDWLKRFRKEIAPLKIRYYLAGEYGDQTERPHYHVALFGLGPCDVHAGRDVSTLIKDTWNLGHIYAGDLNIKSASYIAGYVTKKMKSTNKNNLDVAKWLNGRHPEFARMSLRPGIGASAMEDVAEVMQTDHGLNSILEKSDVPGSLRYGRTFMSIGSYLKSRLRKELGYGEELKKAGLTAFTEKMCDAFLDDVVSAEKGGKSLSEFQIDSRKQKIANLVSRFKIYNPKGSI